MSGDSPEEDGVSIPAGKRAQFEQSLRYNLENLGRTDNPWLGLFVNLTLAATGVAIYYHTTGLVAYAGAVWALINLFGIIKWVFNL